ncbi:hypothetical protein Q765_16510 [Flavobacterium rivuli WB 3.3-2 = DSM 21788]|uniref:Lipoprotein n=2 Tax=Flavobacterium rivuli TaxID=498301 RepID=A0A0A2LY81_9FLAO|nr:hypothetical protein Q765_16510 [Flavobacterium rivuli WB 3.3-2 = DSM 21788]
MLVKETILPLKRFMKKCLLLLAVLLMLTSCSVDNEPKVNFDIVFIPADSITTPASVTPGRTYAMDMYYKKPNDCFYVTDLYKEPSGYTLTLAVQAYFIQDATCAESLNVVPEKATYNFQCPLNATDSYKFKFYKGDDAAGNSQFIEVDIPVRQ